MNENVEIDFSDNTVIRFFQTINIRIKQSKSYGRLILVMILGIVIICLFAFQIVGVGIYLIEEQSDELSVFYSIINAVMFGMYLNVLGFVRSAKFQNRILLFTILLAIFVLGLGRVGIAFSLAFLPIPLYQSFSNQSIKWIVGNSVMLFTIYTLTFMTEGEKE